MSVDVQTVGTDQFQKDIQVLRDICTKAKKAGKDVTMIPALSFETHPMPWQILLDDQTRTLNLEIANALYMTRPITSLTQPCQGSFLTSIDLHGLNITEAFIKFEDAVTGDVFYPLPITELDGACTIKEVVNIPLLRQSEMYFCINGQVRIRSVKSLSVPTTVRDGMIKNAYEKPIFFGRDRSLCIFKGHVRYAKDVLATILP